MTSPGAVAVPGAPGALAAAEAPGRGRREPVLLVAALMLCVVGTRSLDAVPGVQYIRPALTIGLLGGSWALLRAGFPRVQRAATHRVIAAVLLLYAWGALTLPLAIYPGLAFKSLQGALPALLLVLTILVCPPRRSSVDYLQRAFVLGCIVTGAGSLARGVYVEEGRLSGFGTLDANDLAAVMSMGALAAIGMGLRRGRTMGARLAWLAGAAFCVFVLTKTGSRGGFLAISVSVITLVALQPGRRKATLAVSAVLVSAFVWAVAPTTFRDRVGGLVAGETDYNTFDYYGRKQIARRGVGYMLANPVAGVGLGNFGEAEGRDCRARGRRVCRWKAAHNMYVQVGAELGFVGFGLFLGLLVTSLRAAWQVARPRFQQRFPLDARPELLAMLLGYCVSGYFLSHAYLYVALALMALTQLALVSARHAMAGAAVPRAAAPPQWTLPRGRRGGLAVGAARYAATPPAFR